MKKFRAIIPPGTKGGQVLSVNATQPGRQSQVVRVRIPKHLNPGDAFVFHLDEKEESSSGEADSAPIEALPSDVEEQPSVYAEFGTAVCLGMLVGMSIVLGFIVGVLHVSDPEGAVKIAYPSSFQSSLSNGEL